MLHNKNRFFFMTIILSCLITGQLSAQWGTATSATRWVWKDGYKDNRHNIDWEAWDVNGLRPAAWDEIPAVPYTKEQPQKTLEFWGSSAQQGELAWTKATDAAPWAPRSSFEALSFSGKMWILGGDDPNGALWGEFNDVWCSSNGVNWTQVTAAASWAPRESHRCVVFQGRMWLIGGCDSYGGKSDVWSSLDGVNWDLEVEEAPWGKRYKHKCFVYDDKIWIVEGRVEIFGMERDVWNSADGVTWTKVGDLPWEEYGFDAGSIVVYEDAMWMLGCADDYGLLFNVYRSTDGLTWDLQGTMPPADGARAVLINNQFFLAGGWCDGHNDNRVFYSPNATNWTELLPSPPWGPRGGQARITIAHQNKVWMLTGYYQDIGYLTDVWYGELLHADFSVSSTSGEAPLEVAFTDESTWFNEPITAWAWDFGDGAVSTEQHPAHTYAARGAYTVRLTVTNASGDDTETRTNCVIASGEDREYHHADTDQNAAISLSELLRVIQFYNTGALHAAEKSEDGYAPGQGPTTAPWHDSDYAPPDWQINLSEVLRLVQCYHHATYTPCDDGEDGFCLNR